MSEALRVQAAAPPRSIAARVFGRSPLSLESRPWYLGAIGELEVGRLLDQLGAGWSTIHAIPIGTAGSDIDHLVIGPGGVFTINSKYHEGTKVWVGGKRLLVNGQRTDHLRNAAFEAERVGRMLSNSAGRRVDATPVVAIVGARSIVVRERPIDVVVLSSNHLVRWLQSRPPALRAESVTELVHLAYDTATWGQPSIAPADLARFAALREEVATARRRRRVWAAAVLLSPFALLATGLLGLFR